MKDLSMIAYFDVYASLLSEKKRSAFELYYIDDLSLSEISEHTGTSRQGVRDLVGRACEELNEFENKLHLLKKKSEISKLISSLSQNADENDKKNLLRLEEILDE